MIKIVNAALYNVDLEGDDFGEFGGEHPTLVIQSKMEADMYIAIPFTTYTQDRWEKMKKYMCCRVKSTNSIARIDKMEIITVDKIKNRWRENGKLLIPTKEDLEKIFQKSIAYFQASFNKGLSEFDSVSDAYFKLKKEFDDVVVREKILKESFISIDCSNSNIVRIVFTTKAINKISINELYDILNSVFERKKYRIFLSDSKAIAEVFVTDRKALTLKQKHDKMAMTEG